MKVIENHCALLDLDKAAGITNLIIEYDALKLRTILLKLAAINPPPLSYVSPPNNVSTILSFDNSLACTTTHRVQVNSII